MGVNVKVYFSEEIPHEAMFNINVWGTDFTNNFAMLIDPRQNILSINPTLSFSENNQNSKNIINGLKKYFSISGLAAGAIYLSYKLMYKN